MPDRRRRRILLLRLAFYAGVACAGLALIAARGDGGGERPWVGTTAHGTPVSLEPGPDGRVRRIDLQVRATCPSTGETWAARWWVDADHVPFRWEGDRVRVHEEWWNHARDGAAATNAFSIDARVSDEYAEGVIEFAEFGIPAEGSSFECRGGPVRFTAQR